MRISGICPKHGYYQGSECSKCFKQFESSFYTSKDKLWDFIDYKSTGKPVEIRSKGQWKRHLKQHGLTDDMSTTVKEQPYKPTDRRWIADQINRELQEKGLRNKVWRGR